MRRLVWAIVIVTIAAAMLLTGSVLRGQNRTRLYVTFGSQDISGAVDLVTRLNQGRLETGHMYTVTLMLEQCSLDSDPSIIPFVSAILDAAQPYDQMVAMWTLYETTVRHVAALGIPIVNTTGMLQMSRDARGIRV